LLPSKYGVKIGKAVSVEWRRGGGGEKLRGNHGNRFFVQFTVLPLR